MATAAFGGYYASKLQMGAFEGSPVGVPDCYAMRQLWEIFQNGRVAQIYRGEIESTFNVKYVGTDYWEVDGIMSSKKPIPDTAALKGMKFRCGDEMYADILTALGAATVWFPGTEIYTSPATGVVDAFTYGSAYDHLGLKANEVAKYWLRYPPLAPTASETWIVNRDIQNEMTEDLHDLMVTACDAAAQRVATESKYRIAESWKIAIESGVIPVYWDKDSAAKYAELAAQWQLKKAEGKPDVLEYIKILEDFRKFMGYD